MRFLIRIPNSGLDEKIFLLLLFLIINPISYARINPAIISAVSIAWVVFSYCSVPKTFSGCMESPMFVLAAIYPISLFLYSFRSDVVFEKRSVVDCVIILSMLFYLRKNGRNTIKSKLRFVLLYLMLIASYSIVALMHNPMVSRMMAGHREYGNLLIGGYNTVYGLVLFSLAILGIAISKKKYRVGYFLFVVFILMSQYAMALGLLATGTILVIFEKNKKVSNIFGLCIILLIMLILLFPQEFAAGIVSVSDCFPEGTFQKYRIRQLGEIISGFIEQGIIVSKTTEGTVSRIDLYRITFETISNNLMWGAGNTSRQLVGGHATFLDAIAQYGLLCGSVLVITRICLFAKIMKLIPCQYRYCYRIVALLYFALGFLNTINDMMISMIVYLAIPYLFIIEGNSRIDNKTVKR